MVYTRENQDSNIWRMPGPASSQSDIGADRIAASTQFDMEPQYSPDGSKIAFTSARSGTLEIWISDRDGRAPEQVTTIGGPQIGSPRWSPDRRWLAFDNPQAGNYDIYIVSVDGGPCRRFTAGPSNETRPSWSRDGKWIYFSSTRGGDQQIWKAPVAGGAPVQVTHVGGEEAFESLDGKYLYWTRRTLPGIWRMPVSGGEEKLVIPSGRQNLFAMGPPGVLFVDLSVPATPKLLAFDESVERVAAVAEFPKNTYLDRTSTAMSVSPDGRSILYTQYEQSGSNLMLVDPFR